jgi:hypothetical protein
MNEYGAFVGMILTGTPEVIGEKPVPMPLFSPQIPHWLVWD